MKIQIKELRSFILEALGAMKLLDVVEVRLVLAKEKKVEEILTDIRVIKGVATVSQEEPMQRLSDGTRTMTVLITFKPENMDQLEYIDAMAHVMKKIEDVVTIVIKTLNGQPVRDATGKRKLVY